MKILKALKKPLFANLTWGELGLLLLGAMMGALIMVRNVQFNGSEWDTLLYLNTAQHPIAAGAILNRYVDIYLQKLFLGIFPQPLEAAKSFWAFQIFTTSVLVYLCSKLLNLKNTALTGVFALLFFFAQRKIYASAGTPLVDFTAMLFICSGLLLYLVYIHSKTKPNWILFAMGLVQFLLLKSKETGLIFIPILIAAIFLSKPDWPGRFRSGLWVAAGGLSGILLLASLDGIFLHDPFFSFRLASWKEFFRYNLTLVYDQRSDLSWYDVILTTALLLPILFAIFSILDDQKEQFTLAERLAWTLPLFHVIFLSITVFRASFPMNFRYMYPAFATISIVGAQFFRFDGKREKRFAPLILLGSAILAALMYYFLYPFVASLPYRWTQDNFFSNIINSVMVSIVFLILLIPRSLKVSRNLLLIPPVVILLFTPILNIPQELNTTRARAENSISPFVVYENRITMPEGASLFFTSTPYTEFGMLGRNSGTCEFLFEAYFNSAVPEADYSDSIEDILLKNYDYAFVTRSEFGQSQLDDDLAALGYVVFDDPRSEVVLISH